MIEFANIKNPVDGPGLVVVGGYIYRGETLPQFDGRYIFGTWSQQDDVPDGVVFVAKPHMQGLWKFQELEFTTVPNGELGHYLLVFGKDLAGEVYVLTTDHEGPSVDTGKVYRLISLSGKTR